eukprot:168190_1
MLKQLSKLRGECIISNTTMSDMSQSREPKATPKQSPKQQPNEAACRTKTAQICTTQTIQKAPPKPSQQAPFTQNLKQFRTFLKPKPEEKESVFDSIDQYGISGTIICVLILHVNWIAMNCICIWNESYHRHHLYFVLCRGQSNGLPLNAYTEQAITGSIPYHALNSRHHGFWSI